MNNKKLKIAGRYLRRLSHEEYFDDTYVFMLEEGTWNAYKRDNGAVVIATGRSIKECATEAQIIF